MNHLSFCAMLCPRGGGHPVHVWGSKFDCNTLRRGTLGRVATEDVRLHPAETHGAPRVNHGPGG